MLPLQLAPNLRQSPALRLRPACACHNWRISTTRAPLDNVILRYALNMATDKDATVAFLGTRTETRNFACASTGRVSFPTSLTVNINGTSCDVLSYNPRQARELWNSEAPSTLRDPVPIHYFARLDSHLLAEVLQHQWRENLGLKTTLMPHEASMHIQTNLSEGDFTGVAEDSYFAGYPDPYDFLSLYTTTYPNWSDREFDRSLSVATSTQDPAVRMDELAKCERSLLQGMPFVPLYFDTWVYLERPDLHGLSLSPRGIPAFKYAWFDTAGRWA